MGIFFKLGGSLQINTIIKIYFIHDYFINLLTVLTVLVVIVLSMLPLSVTQHLLLRQNMNSIHQQSFYSLRINLYQL